MDKKIYENGEQFAAKVLALLKIDIAEYKKRYIKVADHEVSM